MSLYEEFSLLPPPPRTWLSTVDESRRARLPDLSLEADPAEALRRWAHAIYCPDLSGAWIHIYICIGLMCVLMVRSRSVSVARLGARDSLPSSAVFQILTSASVFIRQWRRKTFWLVRSECSSFRELFNLTNAHNLRLQWFASREVCCLCQTR